MHRDQTTTVLQKLKFGYAQLLGVSADTLDRPGVTFVEAPLRDQPEWANWVHPIWLFSIGSTLICSTSPEYSEQVKAAFHTLSSDQLLSTEALALARTVISEPARNGEEWVQCELLFYPSLKRPELRSPYLIDKLQPTDERAKYFLRHFDGGVYGIRVENNAIAAHVGIKNKGLLQEIAVGTEPDYQRRGMGKAVVTYAVTDILKQGKVPVYWPDTPQNTASYALAHSLGFQKVAEMLFCCYALPNWPGFPLR